MGRHRRNIMPCSAGLSDLPRAVIVGAVIYLRAGAQGVLTSAKVVEAFLRAERLR